MEVGLRRDAAGAAVHGHELPPGDRVAQCLIAPTTKSRFMASGLNRREPEGSGCSTQRQRTVVVGYAPQGVTDVTPQVGNRSQTAVSPGATMLFVTGYATNAARS